MKYLVVVCEEISRGGSIQIGGEEDTATIRWVRLSVVGGFKLHRLWHYLQSPITTQEDVAVDAAGIWGEEGHAHYPGRSANLLCATGVERRREGLAEVSRGHTSRSNHPIKGRT